MLLEVSHVSKIVLKDYLRILIWRYKKIIFEIEGCNIDFVNENEKLRSEIYSHLSEDSTTQSHIISMLNDMKKNIKLEKSEPYGKVLVIVVNNIVVAHHYILFLYFLLTIILKLLE